MAVPNTFTNGTIADADEVNANFTWTGLVPVGSVLPWLKSLTNCPALDDRFVECNGQTLSDAASVFNGVVIPDLNGGNKFLRGASTSGGTGGSETHTHSHATTTSDLPGGGGYTIATGNVTGATSTLPSYYAVVWVIRVK
jgi:hypothetical protein